ncbi:MAG: FKBP-type peptidyl-prolyl cis-trans isomerase [Candidatus Aminicenantes bacterium]|nr:MAG: FKBP-type peptidyl-prolyl cis-trans isomerase [Candidatus Aminicenantes bacterium]
MKRIIIVFTMIILPFIVVNCANSTGSKNPGKTLTLETERQKSSYSVGYKLGVGVKSIAQEVDIDIVLQGFKDAVSPGTPKIPEPQMRQIFSKFQKKMNDQRQKRLKETGEKNKIAGEQFLKQNAKQEGIIVTKSGLQYKVFKEGTGPIPGKSDIVKVHYRGTLINGKEIINTYKRGQPATLPLQRVIPAWAEGFQLMKVGSRYQFFIPSKLAYGERGSPPLVGPNNVLIYEVELLGIVPQAVSPSKSTKRQPSTKTGTGNKERT